MCLTCSWSPEAQGSRWGQITSTLMRKHESGLTVRPLSFSIRSHIHSQPQDTILILISNAFLIHSIPSIMFWFLGYGFRLMLASSGIVSLDIQAELCFESGSGKARLAPAYFVCLNHSSCLPSVSDNREMLQNDQPS